jgi:phage tail sheath protein FI
LLAAINASSIANEVTAFAGPTSAEIYVRLRNPLGTLNATATTNLTVTVDNPTSPQSYDYVYAIENAFDLEDELAQGFILAPEAFQTLATQSERVSVGSALIAQASDDAFDWVALPDVGSGLTPAQAKAEALLYSSPQGHASVYYPYLIDLEDSTVPPSAAVAGLASRRYREQGYPQPAAGAKYPLLGVKDVVVKINTQVQDDLNPSGLNVIRNLRGKGICVWGMRTRSSDTFYTFLHTRVIMNVLNGTLRRGFTNDIFSNVDGQGVFLNAISQTAASVCSRLWREKALFGATEAQAFEVKCDFENNPPSQLENGQVLLEVYAATAPAMEKLLINTIRVNIGTLPQNTSQIESQVLTQQ